jgi:hypothetical protein
MGALLALVLVACGTSAPDTGSGETTSTSSPPTTLSSPSTTGVEDELPEDVISSIRSDASDRTGIELDQIVVSSVAKQTFSDTSLGCPEEGKMYAQVLTPGFQVLVEAGADELDYRVSDGDYAYRLCE